MTEGGTCGLQDIKEAEAEQGQTAPTGRETGRTLLSGRAIEDASSSGRRQGADWNTPNPIQEKNHFLLWAYRSDWSQRTNEHIEPQQLEVQQPLA